MPLQLCPGCLTDCAALSDRCASCGHELSLEVARPTSRPCPGCGMLLGQRDLGPVSMDVCERGCGVFVERDGMARLPSPSATAAPAAAPAEAEVLAEPVRYRRCPACDGTMNRKLVGRGTGIVVDVCATHGVWFDRGELQRTAQFLASGGLRDLLGQPGWKPDWSKAGAKDERAGITATDVSSGVWELGDGLSVLCEILTALDL